MRLLEDIIRDEISREGPIPFARYMALALYHPTLGYYAGGVGREPLGWSGDYFTSGDVSPLWGWAIARQLRQMWELLGSPARFDVIEAGAGRGLLAREVWRFAIATSKSERNASPLSPRRGGGQGEGWAEALRYTMVDQAAQTGEAGLAPTADPDVSSLFAARRERLAGELARIGVPDGGVRWVPTLSSALNAEDAESTQRTRRAEVERGEHAENENAAQIGGETALHSLSVTSVSSSATSALKSGSASPAANSRPSSPPRAGEGGGGGVILSNELLDALPVHIVQVTGGTRPALAEVYVDVDASGRLVERLDAPSSPEVAGYLDRFGVPWRGYGSGWRAEVCLAAEAWMREAADVLGRGFVLTIDYGATARRLYTRDRRHGTLAVYAGHQFGDRPLVAPGHQDITAHVHFSALARAGGERGLRTAGYTTQAAFLAALGVREAAAALGKRLYPAADTERQTDRGQADLLRRRMLEGAAATLLDPRGLGGFRVLVQQRDVGDARHRLLGLPRQKGEW